MIRLGLTIAGAIILAFVVIVLLLNAIGANGNVPTAPCKEAPQYQCAVG